MPKAESCRSYHLHHSSWSWRILIMGDRWRADDPLTCTGKCADKFCGRIRSVPVADSLGSYSPPGHCVRDGFGSAANLKIVRGDSACLCGPPIRCRCAMHPRSPTSATESFMRIAQDTSHAAEFLFDRLSVSAACLIFTWVPVGFRADRVGGAQ